MKFHYLIIPSLTHPIYSAIVDLPNHLRLSGKTVESSRLSTTTGPRLVDQYIGIPFAAPPTGELRFRPPSEYSGKWSGVREFVTSTKGCYTGKEGTSEDCLYLNVFRPAGMASTEKLPVMVWIFGGGFTAGKVDLYNGTELAAREGVVVVVPSYRLGAFGFYSAPALMNESGTTGNWGILDQQLALRWVQSNIGAFGGDKSKVVLFGQSAGAISISAHLVTKGSRGLFASAILSSPTASSPYFFQRMEDAYQFSNWMATTVAKCVDANDLECLRSVPASKLVVSNGHRDIDPPEWASRLFPYMPWGMTIDGTVLEGTPLELAALGRVANVPVMIGVTQHEGSAFSLVLRSLVRPTFKSNIKPSQVAPITSHLLGDPVFTAELMEDYPLYEKAAPFVNSSTTKAPPNSTVSAEELSRQIEQLKSFDLAQMSKTDIVRIAPALARSRPVSPEGNYDKAPLLFFMDALRDSMFACPSLDFATALAANNGGRVWFYNFALDVWADTPWNSTSVRALVPGGSDMTLSELGAFHSSELPFIWNLFPEKHALPGDVANINTFFTAFTAPQFCPANSFKRTVANQMGCLWANMARCGGPQCGGTCNTTTTWNKFDAGSVLSIDNRGEYVMKTVQQSGRAPVGAFMPSMGQCAKWKNLHIPFHNFAQDSLNRTSPIPPLQAASAIADSNSGISSVSSLRVVALITLIGFLI